MKKCTWCGKEYPDEATFCSLDEQSLSSCSPDETTITEAARSKTWLPQIVIPAALWLVVNFLLAGLFTVGASLLFGFATALWAAVDCSKLQSTGSRVLGIAFKPVVVFAVCAFFLWGFGFIWYLIMRHRVKRLLILENEKVATL